MTPEEEEEDTKLNDMRERRKDKSLILIWIHLERNIELLKSIAFIFSLVHT